MRSTWLFALSAMFAGDVHAAPLTCAGALRLAEQSAPSLQANLCSDSGTHFEGERGPWPEPGDHCKHSGGLHQKLLSSGSPRTGGLVQRAVRATRADMMSTIWSGLSSCRKWPPISVVCG